ncbi:MAG: 2-amino-4-hydroxy-6-hydroxymethyldihydropteridine diphosphokinase [Alicyclobacillus sp.]|nr:2-amino-4-hydroxy-6-hydroxymethyldihydropteridine diphosphokinase [Alicyclobacillus sp.]
MTDTVTAWVGVGSNIGRRLHHLKRAVHGLRSLAVNGTVRCSPIYETDPVGYLEQPRFLNMAATFETALGPWSLLRALQMLEREAGRVRGVRFGPRTLDLDLLLYGDHVMESADLTVPHPRMHERLFALVPVLDLDAQAQFPNGQPLESARQRLGSEGGIRYVGRFW